MRGVKARILFWLVSIIATALLTYQFVLAANCFAADNGRFSVASSVVPSSSSLSLTNAESRIRQLPSLYHLLDTEVEGTCPQKLVLMEDKRIGSSISSLSDWGDHNSIPKIIHVTTKSRCLPPSFHDNLELWKKAFPDYSFVLHNDAAMYRLLELHHVDFPHLQQSLKCSVSVAAIADLWRALILYEYGGIYTDIDNAPRKLNAFLIKETDQAFFVVEEAGYLSQYFMASAPKHPLLFLLIQSTLHRLYDLNDVDHQYVPFVTGPGALKQAFLHFLHEQGPNAAAVKNTTSPKNAAFVQEGVYTGIGNATVTVVGRRGKASDEYVARNVIYKKRRIYAELMNMTHFSRVHADPSVKSKLTTDSCMERLWHSRNSNRQ
ncbi:hypothetical protein FisN_24Hu017 [Fistulifera solaris]|uniref:Uncharacterized protein n=1 Tax=Fistulifera solaris TaxID=1519565 RepID=A0A1Z5KIH4_FISSO|nr:hypothetical protein FisN_24Hu017 [Fistulifera solaris]|eukprot:GAX26110.1 hypothetical protein FisN_24Hu017 [Fistulifera solaris]